MASIVYRVTGTDPITGERTTVRCRDAKSADAVAKPLAGVQRHYDVVLRIDGRKVSKSFARRRDADAWADSMETDRREGRAVDPRRARITVLDYATSWLNERTDLRETTRGKYTHLLERHVAPQLGSVELGALRLERVRSWFRSIQKEHETTANDAYRFLRAVLNTAVEDGRIAANPCRIKGAGTVKTRERPTAAPALVAKAVAAVPERYQAAILLAAWGQLRRGELLGLQRRHVDLTAGTLTIHQARTVTSDGRHVQGDPKTEAGRRVIRVPANVVPALAAHLDAYVGPGEDAYLFTSEAGHPITPRTLDRVWERARSDIGSDTLHLHDLRHSGLTWAAASGASTAQLMARGGHASPAAALRYQHATQDQDSELARRLAALADAS